jgi:hypothetical protein
MVVYTLKLKKTDAVIGEPKVVANIELKKKLVTLKLFKVGPRGFSAYEVWLLAGNTGTVDDFFDSIGGGGGGVGTHAELPDLATSGHPANIIAFDDSEVDEATDGGITGENVQQLLNNFVTAMVAALNNRVRTEQTVNGKPLSSAVVVEAVDVPFDDEYIKSVTGETISGENVQAILDSLLTGFSQTIGGTVFPAIETLQTGLIDLTTVVDGKINSSEKGQSNGVATLDGGGKVPSSQLPNSIMEYKGTWSANSNNAPTLADGIGDTGDVYRVRTAGTINLGSGAISFSVGDYVVYNGSVWEKSDTTDSVPTVFNRTGNIEAQAGDYSASQVTNDSTVTGDFVDDALNTLKTSVDAKADTTTVTSQLANKSDVGHNHDSRYYTESEVDTLLGGKANTSHNHDDRYYTEAEVNALLANKSDTSHTHDSRYYQKSEVYTQAEVDALLAANGFDWNIIAIMQGF